MMKQILKRTKNFFDASFWLIVSVSLVACLIYFYKGEIELPLVSHRENGIMHLLWENLREWLHYPDINFTLLMMLQFTAPISAAFAGVLFHSHRETIMKFEFSRENKRTDPLFATMFAVSLKIATATYMVFIILQTLALLFFKVEYNVYNEPYFLRDIIGQSFSQNNIVIYTFVAGFFRFFLSIFFLSLIACFFSFLAKKKAETFLYMLLYFFGWTIMTLRLPTFHIGLFDFESIRYYLSPAIMFSPETIAPAPNTMGILAAGLVPTLIALYLSWRHIRAYEI